MPLGSIVVAIGVMTIVLLATHHAPGHTFRRLFDSAFVGQQSLNATFISATPLIFTGLCAAIAFRMQLFNIGGEGQLYAGAIVGAAAAIAIGNHSGWLSIPAMIVAGAAGGAALALVPAILRAFFSTNEIITSLMLNYVGALVINYLIFDSQSYWRDTSSATAKVFPQGKNLPDSASWPVAHVGFARAAVRAPARSRRRGGDLGPLHAHALRLRGAGDRRLAACSDVCGHADAAEDPRRDGALRCGCRYRWRARRTATSVIRSTRAG